MTEIETITDNIFDLGKLPTPSEIRIKEYLNLYDDLVILSDEHKKEVLLTAFNIVSLKLTEDKNSDIVTVYRPEVEAYVFSSYDFTDILNQMDGIEALLVAYTFGIECEKRTFFSDQLSKETIDELVKQALCKFRDLLHKEILKLTKEDIARTRM